MPALSGVVTRWYTVFLVAIPNILICLPTHSAVTLRDNNPVPYFFLSLKSYFTFSQITVLPNQLSHCLTVGIQEIIVRQLKIEITDA